MRQVATLPEPSARAFADYLLTLQIETRLDPGEAASSFVVWVLDEDKVPRARQELAEFNRNPADPRYRQAAPVAQALRVREAVAAADLQHQQQRQEDEARRRDSLPEAGTPGGGGGGGGAERPLTIALIAASVIVALATNFGAPAPGAAPEQSFAILDLLRIAPLNSDPARPLAAVGSGEVWRLVTPIFIHLGLMHLLFNMIMLLSLGGRVEAVRGPGRLLVLVLVFAVLSNVAQLYFQWSLRSGLSLDPNPNFGGMSGVLYGLFGYMWMKGRFDPDGGLLLPADTVIILLGWFLLCALGLFDTDRSRIANVAHGAGLLVGVVVGVGESLFSRQA